METIKNSDIDAELFPMYEEVKFSDVGDNLQITDTERKQEITDAWQRGESPDLSVLSVDLIELENKKNKLLELKSRLINDESVDVDLKQLYRWKINEDIAKVSIVIASLNGDANRFNRYNKFIYGMPNESIYRGALDWVYRDAYTIVEDEKTSDDAKVAAEVVIDMLSDKKGDYRVIVPDDGLFESVRNDHWSRSGFYALLLSGVEIPEGIITSESGDPIIKQILNNKFAAYSLERRKQQMWSVNHEDKVVKAPMDYSLKKERFIGLALGHEIGTHISGAINAQSSPLKLMSIGLDRQDAGGEGRAVVREQVAYEAFDDFGKHVRWQEILNRHIAISFACGLEGTMKPSGEVWDFMNKINIMYQFMNKPDISIKDAQSASLKKTNALLLRILKGTNGQGGAYLKDKVYLEGNVASWIEAAHRGPGAITEGDMGRFDIANPRHLKYLQAFDLLPTNEMIERGIIRE